MLPDYQKLQFDYRPSPDRHAAEPPNYPVVVVGAGPVGLATAVDLAQQGVPVVLLDDDSTLSTGSRAICFSKRTLEIFDRLGCGERMVQKGVSWNVGKVFLRDELIYAFNLLPEAGHARPAFINLQQYYVEGFLAERAQQLENIDIRWSSRVVGFAETGTGAARRATLTIETPDGPYTLQARYVVAADGSKSQLRRLLGLDPKGRTFKDRFLIADVKMKADFPTERWFWFDPPFHRNQSVLLHRQPDNVWRIDFQLGWDADPVVERQPERVLPRIRALLGPDAEFELEWVSVYTFSCQRIERFRHGTVLFAGDSAHGVSPFGARGANSGVQDAENLAWKLRMVLTDVAPDSLLDSYASEREFAADENILNSTRSTDFISPKSDISRTFRDAALMLAKDCPFARRIVNSGRLSVPAVLVDSLLNSADMAADGFAGAMVPGAPAADAPVARLAPAASIASQAPRASSNWFLQQIGNEFTGVLFGAAESLDPATLAALRELAAPRDGVQRDGTQRDLTVRLFLILPQGTPATTVGPLPDNVTLLGDIDGLLQQRYDGQPGSFYLFRPDQHVCARWRRLALPAVRAALGRATGHVDSASTDMPANPSTPVAAPGRELPCH